MKRTLACVLLVSILMTGVSPTMAAPTQTITVLNDSIESHFPDDLTFHLSVSSDAGDIVAATLHLQVGWENASRMVLVEPFSPGTEVDLVAIWDTVGETVPPFIEIEYHWEVTDSAGGTLTTDTVYTEYKDFTHDWQRLEDEQVIVFWHDQPDSFGEGLFLAAQEAYEHVARITGATTEDPIRVVIYNFQTDFCAFYAPNSCELWIGGQTFEGITVQWGTNLDWLLYDVVPHELAHVFYNEVFRHTWISVPTWFNEGIAVYNERTDHVEDMNRVLRAAERDELESLPVMTRGAGVAEGDAGTWYSIVYSIVAFIADEYGEETLGELILTMAENVQFEDALIETTGMDMVQLEIGWREWLGYPVDSVPTPIVLAPLEITPFGLPTAQRGEPAATSEPRPEPTETTAADEPTEEPTETPDMTAPGAPCFGLIGLAIPIGGLMSWGLSRRRKQWSVPLN